MKFILFIFLCLFLIGCGNSGKTSNIAPTCYIEDTDNGALIKCIDGTIVVINDGEDGEDGEDGVDGRDGEDGIIEIVDPCGDYPGHFDEVLLITSAGDIIAYFKENGSREFLSILTPGDYQTTDTQKCNFTVELDGSIVW